MLGFQAIKCIGRKLRTINKLIGPNVQFKLDEISGIIYAICAMERWRVNNDGESIPVNEPYCFYIDFMPKGLLNILRKRSIVSASAKFNYTNINNTSISLTCNTRNYNLTHIRIVPYMWEETPNPLYTLPFSVYPLKEQLYMGVSAKSMFIGNVIYSSDSDHGLYEVKRPCGKTIIVSLESGSTKVIEGIKTTMSTENYEKYNTGVSLSRDDLTAYGLRFDEPNDGYGGPTSHYPLFYPIIPKNARENNMGQLVIENTRGNYTFNSEMYFSKVVFHKNEDWPIELIQEDGESCRFNVIMASCFVSGGYSGSYYQLPHLVDTKNRAFEFYWGDHSSCVPNYNKYGPFTDIAHIQYVKYGKSIPIDQKIMDMFSTTIKFSLIVKDVLGNYYGRDCNPSFNDIDPETDIKDGGSIFRRIYLKNSTPTRTKPALHTIEE